MQSYMYFDPYYKSSFTGKTCSPLLHYHFVNHANSCGNAIANSLGLLHAETGFSYFGARYYDSDLMTGWLSVDPLADKYPGHSPYQYYRWNPIILKDPNGLFDIKTGKIEKGDNLTLIANMINSQYNINLSVSDIAKANDISNYNLIKEGDHIILPGENISLEFNLSNLKVVDNTYNIDMPGLKWNGISGRKGYQSKEFQDMKNIGPIPEGVYILNPEDTQYFSSISLFDKMISSFGGEWRGGKSSWGNVRTWLTPKEGTNTYGRDNFSIHGGSSPGSAGCIDLTSDNDSFHEWFKAYGKSIELNVIY